MRLLFPLVLLGFVVVITAIPTSLNFLERPTSLLDVADAGDLHSNDADRLARHWGGGGWGCRGCGGGGWGRRGWGGGGLGHHGWRSGGWGHRGWRGGGWRHRGWRGGGWGHRGWRGGWG